MTRTLPPPVYVWRCPRQHCLNTVGVDIALSRPPVCSAHPRDVPMVLALSIVSEPHQEA